MEFLKLFERHEDYESASTKPMYAHCINDVEMHIKGYLSGGENIQTPQEPAL